MCKEHSNEELLGVIIMLCFIIMCLVKVIRL
jgi:hypothetical protein